ncbi:MAG: 3-hydroxyacyl-CoA dehydrogenase NAD-binding domain-containing protein [Yoonia sp.]|uniref:3-hydroxyacyl-CoA dehydrogenase NAD-binding domain-containing protein n=1 Tax=Yoonia sp. TaxID=2212373 RepID=UPI00273FF862|nr:3-hydroxyacyl-CoA dehydrogenase NAD-binding domain-containing protein [Yoonia sp.]MDP5085583.1 3-hydroxyacyl-CoA dehydrogenase NAD-binding domain-containing protein [Yoonia sp.]
MTGDLSGTRIAIVGCGLIGLSWAALFRHYGADVTLWDPDAAARAAAEDRMIHPLAQLRELTQGPENAGSVSVTADLAEALKGAALIQENAPEDLSLKRGLYREIEALADPQAVLASSTSALTWSDLAPGLADPGRLITAHPFNPPHLVPLVELYGTDPAGLDRAEGIYRAADRVPVRLKKDATGHIANRLASALWREAVHIVAEGIADVAEVDMALVHGPGLRWSVLGAHMAYHLGGGSGGIEGYLAHLGPSQERRWSTLGTPSLTDAVQAALIEGVLRAAEGRDILTLEAARDAGLIAALKARRMSEDI